MTIFSKVFQNVIARRVILALIIAVILIYGAFVFNGVHASVGLPFGGTSSFVMFCPCSLNFLVVLGPPLGGWFSYDPWATLVYRDFLPETVGVWETGNYLPGTGYCVTGDECDSVIPTLGSMTMVGTSLLP